MAEKKHTRPTMLDVANLSGVSYQTVSRVINNHPYVSDDTRKRVQEAIDKLGYSPSKAATKLRAKSSKTIAIVLYGSWFHGPVQIALNVEMAAKTSGFDVIITNVTETQQQVKEALQHVKDWMVDGIVLILPARGLPQHEIQMICSDIPIVQIDSYPDPTAATISFGDAEGTASVMEHLISLGHRDFCEISGPLNWYNAQCRHEAVLRICDEHGLNHPIHAEGNWTTPAGYQATRRLLQQNAQFSALVVANDSMALGAYRALHEAGLSIPGDVSVVGFDDIPEAAYYTPPLTTVRHNFIELGTRGFEYLLQFMDDPETQIQDQIVPPRFVLRDSTA